jgi:hypothetical protein
MSSIFYSQRRKHEEGIVGVSGSIYTERFYFSSFFSVYTLGYLALLPSHESVNAEGEAL